MRLSNQFILCITSTGKIFIVNICNREIISTSQEILIESLMPSFESKVNEVYQSLNLESALNELANGNTDFLLEIIKSKVLSPVMNNFE